MIDLCVASRGRHRHAFWLQRPGYQGRGRICAKTCSAGHVFAFRGRRRDIIKLLWRTGDGLYLLAKRLERSRFVRPQATSGTVLLSQAQLSMLLEGIDWRCPEHTWKPLRLYATAYDAAQPQFHEQDQPTVECTVRLYSIIQI